MQFESVDDQLGLARDHVIKVVVDDAVSLKLAVFALKILFVNTLDVCLIYPTVNVLHIAKYRKLHWSTVLRSLNELLSNNVLELACYVANGIELSLLDELDQPSVSRHLHFVERIAIKWKNNAIEFCLAKYEMVRNIRRNVEVRSSKVIQDRLEVTAVAVNKIVT